MAFLPVSPNQGDMAYLPTSANQGGVTSLPVSPVKEAGPLCLSGLETEM